MITENNIQYETKILIIINLESNLKTITSSFSKKLSFTSVGLTNKEIQVANLIKEGKQSEDIAEMMNISFETVNCPQTEYQKETWTQEIKYLFKNASLVIS